MTTSNFPQQIPLFNGFSYIKKTQLYNCLLSKTAISNRRFPEWCGRPAPSSQNSAKVSELDAASTQLNSWSFWGKLTGRNFWWSNNFSLPKKNIWMFPKIGGSNPPNHPNFNRVFHYKPSILGYPYFWKHPYHFHYHIVFFKTTLKNGWMIWSSWWLNHP